MSDKAEMRFDVVEGGDRSLKVTVSGELDITNIDALAAAVAPALEREPARLVIEVRDLRFADSSAIALWVQWATAVPDVELHHVPPLLRRVVKTMGLSETLKVSQ
ncbi:MAG: STAS domain-containing protein [Solirubrobacteraceae bacterium]